MDSNQTYENQPTAEENFLVSVFKAGSRSKMFDYLLIFRSFGPTKSAKMLNINSDDVDTYLLVLKRVDLAQQLGFLLISK
jgi:hypothetical protein